MRVDLGVPHLRILLVEDDDSHAVIIERKVRTSQIIKAQLERVSTLQEGLRSLESSLYDVVLLDLRLPDSNLDETLPRTLAVAQSVPVIVLSSLGEVSLAQQMVHQGAQDYLCKLELSNEILARTILSSIERKALICAGLESAKRREAILQGSLDAIITLDENGRIIETNQSADDLFGWQQQLVSSKSFFTFLLLDLKPNLEVSERVNHLLNQRKETRALRNDGSTIPVEVSFIKVKVGNRVLFTVFVRDMTEQKNTQKRLEEALKQRDEFLSIASHEIKTPVTALKLHLELGKLELSRMDPFPKRECLKKVLENGIRQADSLTSLVNELLDLTRIERGQFKILPSRCNMGEIVREVAGRFEPKLTAAGCSLRLETESEVLGDWDRFKIEQILSNLLENITKYASQSACIITLQREGDWVVLKVEDNGPGIPAAVKEHLFSRYFRDNSVTHLGGLGLGLYIIKQIVDAHSGRIDLVSKPGSTRFLIRLPITAGVCGLNFKVSQKEESVCKTE